MLDTTPLGTPLRVGEDDSYLRTHFPVSCTPFAQIRYSSVLIYNKFENLEYYRSEDNDNFKRSNTYSGYVNQHNKKRIQKAINLFLQISPIRPLYNPVTKTTYPFQLGFMTLTIPNNKICVSGKEGYKTLLKPFLTWLRDTKKIITYVWKAEIQERGQLHYHITINEFLHYEEIKRKWNYLLQKANLLSDYFNTYNHYQPNSTDIHSVLKIKKIDAYLCKYLSKQNGNFDENELQPKPSSILVEEIIIGNILSCHPACEFSDYNVGGKTWDCSDNLRGKKLMSFRVDKHMIDHLSAHLSESIEKVFTNEYCSIFYTKNNYPKTILNKRDACSYDTYLESLINPDESEVVSG